MNGNGVKLDLKLNLSPPRESHPAMVVSPNGSSREASPSSSCVSSENQDESRRYCGSPEAATAMVLAGCPRCLMYVMLADADAEPKCPKCKSSVLLNVFYDHSNNATSRNRA